MRNKMNRQALANELKTLLHNMEKMIEGKALLLEHEQTAKAELYQWCREQMLSIHQMKYQFSQEVNALHQEKLKMGQEAHNEIEHLRNQVNGLMNPQTPSPVAPTAEEHV